MRQRQALAGYDSDAMSGGAVLAPLESAPSPRTAFARAQALKHGLEDQAKARRN